MAERRHIKITGRVQGVGFRYFTQRQAQQLGLSGWVRNMPDGSVEAEAQGDPDTLDRFEALLQRGPGSADVNDVQSRSIDPSDQAGRFQVRY